MNLEVVTIGTELVLGQTVDTNAPYLARALAAVGARVVRKTSVPDEPDAIRDAVATALGRTHFVVTTGGLGPTRDDRTVPLMADLFGVPLVTDEPYLARLERRWQRLGRGGPMPEANRTQAQVPEGAVPLPNPRGTARGLWLEGARGTVVLLPGVPQELRALADSELVPRLAARVGASGVIRSCVLRTCGVAESALADRLGSVEELLAPATLAYLPSLDGVDLRLTVWNTSPDEADGVLRRGADRLKDLLGDRCYGEGDTDLAAVVLARARAVGVRVAVAESCTGGLVGARLTAIPGASQVFAGGVIAYDDAVKLRELDVPRDVLARQGAVSEDVVRAMASGVSSRFGVDAALAISGIAGPDGGTPDKPVGTVWLCALYAEECRVAGIGFPGDRGEVRARAAQAGLDLLRSVLPSDGIKFQPS